MVLLSINKKCEEDVKSARKKEDKAAGEPYPLFKTDVLFRHISYRDRHLAAKTITQ